MRPSLVLSTALLVTVALAACGDSSDDSPSTASESSDPGSQTPSVPSDSDPTSDPGDTTPSGEQPSLENNFLVEEAEGNPDCDNLLESNCIMPFPSNYFFVDNEEERRLRFFPTSLPVNARGTQMTDTYFGELDGFGIASPILITWPGASLEGTAAIFQPGESLEEGSLTVVLDTRTGERLPHWVEFDWLTDNARDPVIALRPAVPLAHDTRYVVALRGFVDDAGDPMEPPRGFRALRDREASVVQGVHARRQHFEEHVFAPLEEHGVLRDEIQLAWDFTTATREDSTYLLATMRERMLEIVGEDGPEYIIDSIEPVNSEHIDWMMTGRLLVPSFLLPADETTRIRRIRRDAEGLPVAEGVEEVEFTLQIPANATERDEPLGVLMYGHGFIGNKGQSNGGWLRSQADEYGFLILGLDMQGMTDGSMDVWLFTLNRDATRMPLLAEEVMQGIVNHAAALRMMAGRFLQETDERFSLEGEPIHDPDRIWYYGNSQGGTLGTLVMATSPDVTRGVLGVPGCAFPFLLQRSTVFSDFTGLLGIIYRDPVNVSLTLGLLGSAFNRIDGLVWSHYIEREQLPGNEPRRVLLHVAKEDGQVHNELSFLLGRAIGAPILVPTPPRPWDVWGLDEQPYPWEGSAVTEFDFGIPDQEDLRIPAPAETDTHGWLRRLPEGRDQMMHFLETGEVRNFCDGYCFHDGRPD
ncbi:MAG: hypothetical protein EA398_10600 [Deltaproteobacteria bacterium]|nr:MAG: hypothetical protein EA398_10600 [Deltaproteobacteria bacterium]